MTDGYGVNPQALSQTAKGINDAIAELKTLGIAESAAVGRGFSGIALRGMQVGHTGLQQAFDKFCERWSWGVRSLVHDGDHIASQLHLSAGTYYEAEQYAEGAFKDLVAAGMGDPHQSADAAEKKSWGQVLSDNPINDALHPDFSAQSAQQALHHMGQTWRAEGRDVLEGPMGMNKAVNEAMGLGKEFAQSEDKLLGPDPKVTQTAPAASEGGH